MAKLLITGFDKFGEHQENPTENLVLSLQNKHDNIIAVVLPTSFSLAKAKLKRLLKKHQPDFAVHLGLNGNIDYIALENIALNTEHASIKDNSGKQPVNKKISKSGPLALHSTIDLIYLEKQLTKKKIKAKQSFHTGTFVCNCIHYSSLNFIQENKLKTKSCFIHIPDTNKMSYSSLEKAIHTIISSLLIN